METTISENLKSLIPSSIKDDQVLFDIFVKLLLNETEINDDHRAMFLSKTNTTLDELIFSFRTMINLDRGHKVVRQTHTLMFVDTKSSNKELDKINKKSIKKEVKYLVQQFKGWATVSPYRNQLLFDQGRCGFLYKTFCQQFFIEIEKITYEGFKFRRHTTKRRVITGDGEEKFVTDIGVLVVRI